MIRLLKLVLVFAVMVGALGICPSGWEDLNNRCFLLEEAESLSWDAAKQYCADKGGHLATVDSSETHRALYTYIHDYYLPGSFWVGGSDSVAEGDWQWTDGSRVTRGTPYWSIVSNIAGAWHQEPRGGDSQNCLLMSSDRQYYLDDKECDMEAHPLCQL